MIRDNTRYPGTWYQGRLKLPYAHITDTPYIILVVEDHFTTCCMVQIFCLDLIAIP